MAGDFMRQSNILVLNMGLSHECMLGSENRPGQVVCKCVPFIIGPQNSDWPVPIGPHVKPNPRPCKQCRL